MKKFPVTQKGQAATSQPLRPAHMRPGDTVAIISPGRWMSDDELTTTVARFEKFGFHVVLHPQNFLRDHQFAGGTAERREAIEMVFADPRIRAVMLAKAGYGSLHLLDSLNYDVIRRNPKIIVGYSDATGLLIALHIKCGLVTFHGPMLYDLCEKVDRQTWQWFREVLVERKPIQLEPSDLVSTKVLRSGIGTGPLIGGNLTLLANLIGTSTDFATEGRILFLEDYDEKLYSIDRLLLHLRRAGKLDHLNGLVVGEMHKISDDEIPFGYSVDDLVLKHCESTQFPIVSNFPFGHGDRQLLLPIGVLARLSANPAGVSFELIDPAVA